MNIKVITFNNEEYLFLQVKNFYFEDRRIVNEYKYKTSIENYDNFYLNILNQAFGVNRKFKILIYNIKTEFNNLYSLGITVSGKFILVDYTMDAINYSTDENRLMLYDTIKNYLKSKLLGKLNYEYTCVFLEVLLFYFMDDFNYSEFIKGRPFTDALEELKGFNPSIETINTISNVISKRKIYFSTSYNSFNLHQTNEIQQKALNIKKATSDGKRDMVNYQDVTTDNDDFDLIDTFYIPKEDVVYIHFNNLARIDLITLIAKNFIYKYKSIDGSSPSTINLVAQVKVSQYKFLNLFKIRGRLCQYSVLTNFLNKKRNLIKDDDLNYIDEFTIFKDVEWVYGEEMLYDYNQFSYETLKGNSRRFELYAIFHIDALKALIKMMGCTFIIKRKIGKFYYVSCFIYKYDALDLFTKFIPSFINKTEDLLDTDDHITHLWKMRKMLHVIYHTHFTIHQYLKNEDNIKKMKECMITNLTNFLYIKETGELYSYPTNDILGIRYMGIYIKVQQAVFKDYTDVKFTPIQPKFDGPLVSAVSVRGCENVTNSKYHDKDYNVYASYLSIILNTPNYSGINNDLNKIVL